MQKIAKAVKYDASIPTALTAALTDTARICPILAGTGLLAGNSLTLRLPEGVLNIHAPARLLKKVHAVCDGSTPWDAIVQGITPAARDEFERFLHFLFEQGALIDAVLLTRSATVYTHQNTHLGESPPNAVTATLARRFTVGEAPEGFISHRVEDAPLAAFFDERQSTYTFAPTELSLSQLTRLIWSAAGIVCNEHMRAGPQVPRRTLASAGGLHLLTWRLVLQRGVGPHPAGVYEVLFPTAAQIALRLISSDITPLPRCFNKPWQLGASAGVLFALADAHIASLRYRNRAVPYLFLEAGAAFQNVCLSAPKLGLACAQIGGYSDEHVAALCAAGREMVLGSLIFGAQPEPAHLEADRTSHAIDFVWGDSDNDTYATPFHIARARPPGVSDDSRNTWGRDRDPRLAYIKAHAEAVERDGMVTARDITIARLDELPHALHPAQILGYSAAQYRSSGFPHRPFDAQATYHWRAGVDLASGRDVFIPAQFIHGTTSLAHLPISGGSIMQCNSSGCAAGVSIESATLAALLELIERDAFMRHWLSQTPGQAIAPAALPASIQARLNQMQQAGCEVVAQRLDTPFAQVALVSARHDARHFTCVGAAARFDLIEAIDAALDELETTVYTRLMGQDFEPLTPRQVRNPADHTLFYAQARHYRRADRVLTPTTQLSTPALLPSPKGSPSSLAELTGKMQAMQVAPCAVDITPAACHIDQGRIRLHVVKAIAPGLLPISFGFGLEPLGMLGNKGQTIRFPHPFP